MADVELDHLFAAQLYLDDVRRFQGHNNSTYDERTEEEDETLAFQLQFGDLAAYLQILEDARLAQSIGESSGVYHNSTQSDDTQASAEQRPIQCAICFDPIAVEYNTRNSALQVSGPCGHHLCNYCVRALALQCTKDESMYPPRCCQTILSIDELEHRLVGTSQRSFRTKMEEYAVPSKERIYCPQPKCSAFLGRKSKPEPTPPTSPTTFLGWMLGSSSSPAQKHKECHACKTLVCPLCAQPFHPKTTCEKDASSLASLTLLASNEKWRKCPGCSTFIQKAFGCEHMVCRCKTEFCFTCGVAPWKTCKC